MQNAFRYSIDYVLCDAEAPLKTPRLFGRNRRVSALFRMWTMAGLRRRGRVPLGCGGCYRNIRSPALIGLSFWRSHGCWDMCSIRLAFGFAGMWMVG